MKTHRVSVRELPSIVSNVHFPSLPSYHSMNAITMGFDGLDNPERAQLLSVVDEFRSIGISKEIALPQVSNPSRHGISLTC